MNLVYELAPLHNGLTAIDPAVAKLTALTFLNLENNNLEKLPDEIGHMAGMGERWLQAQTHLALKAHPTVIKL